MKKTLPFEWEIISNESGDTVRRARVIGGWMVLTYVCECEAPGTHSTVFIPDIKHEWRVKT